MKVYIPINQGVVSGANLFCRRLSKALKNLGVHVTNSAIVKHDVSLHRVILKKANSKFRALRLDSVYHDVDIDYKKRNAPIRKSLLAADAIVYQGNFAKKICDKYIGKTNKNFTIISNGVDPNYYSRISPRKKECEHAFLTASRWRPQKRLVDIMESFLLADILHSKLYVAGDVFKNTVSKKLLNKYFKEPSIEYIGLVNQAVLASYLKIVDGYIHISWFDCCPNSVVEAIAAKVPVITNNVGGTQEIVGPSGGFVLPIDQPYNMKPCKLYEPPVIDRNIVAKAISDCCSKRFEIDNSHVDIHHIAEEYKKFFEGIYYEI